MEARELRIGNLVSTPYAEVYECDSFAINHVAYGKLSVNPIILTEEWLLKFGFEKVKNNWMVLDLIALKFTWERLAGLAVVLSYECIYCSHIKSVHQLQNLIFALTGEELTIKQSQL